MDYVETGKIIQLGPRDTIVLSYMSSCVRETITGGLVTIGTDQSELQGGKIARAKVPCDAGKLVLEGDKPGQFAGKAFRGGPAAVSDSNPQLTLYGRSPMLELKTPGTLLIERIDQASERQVVDVGKEQLVHGKFYDFAKWGKPLTAGGIYRVTLGAQEIVFKVDPHAKRGTTPIVGRLLRFVSPS
jgi:hypothetical protein